MHFSPSAASRAAGSLSSSASWRRKDRDPEVSAQRPARAQREAIGKYIAGRPRVLASELEEHPSAHADRAGQQRRHHPDDQLLMSCSRTLPNAQLILYPDANHGSFYQYPELFVDHATLFLDA